MYIDRWPNQSPVGNCYIKCPCGAKGTVSAGSSNSGACGDPCYGWTGPGPCPYYGGFTGSTGSFQQCPCETSPEAAHIGDYLYPSYNCRGVPYKPTSLLTKVKSNGNVFVSLRELDYDNYITSRKNYIEDFKKVIPYLEQVEMRIDNYLNS